MKQGVCRDALLWQVRGLTVLNGHVVWGNMGGVPF